MSDIVKLETYNRVGANVDIIRKAKELNREEAKDLMKSITLPKHLIMNSAESTENMLVLAIETCKELGLPVRSFYSKFFPVNGALLPSIHVWYYLASKNKIEFSVIRSLEPIERQVFSKDEIITIKDAVTECEIKYKNDHLGTIETKRYSVFLTEIKQADLHTKDTYKKYLSTQMIHWCFRNLIRMHRQDILGGGEVYTAEEMMDVQNVSYQYDENGETIA